MRNFITKALKLNLIFTKSLEVYFRMRVMRVQSYIVILSQSDCSSYFCYGETVELNIITGL